MTSVYRFIVVVNDLRDKRTTLSFEDLFNPEFLPCLCERESYQQTGERAIVLEINDK